MSYLNQFLAAAIVFGLIATVGIVGALGLASKKTKGPGDTGDTILASVAKE